MARIRRTKEGDPAEPLGGENERVWTFRPSARCNVDACSALSFRAAIVRSQNAYASGGAFVCSKRS